VSVEKYEADYTKADILFKKAETLSLKSNYNEELEEKLNKEALNLFLTIIPSAEKNKNDSLLFHCYYKTGILYHYFDSLSRALDYYKKAINQEGKKIHLADSFFFKPYLFAGSVYYSTEKFDSSLVYYQQANKILNKYSTPLQETQRLYNRLGAIYFETGNYKQAKNYFEKAVSVLEPGNPFYKEFLFNYKNNIASAHIKLEEYPEAFAIYQSMLEQKINRNEIFHNLGQISLNQDKYTDALTYFNQVNYNDSRKQMLLNDIGHAFYNLKKYDSANFYFRLSETENTKWNRNSKNIQQGINLKYTATLLNEEGKFEEAVTSFQLAIIQFDNDFNEKNIYKNPESFSGIFSFINLFNALTGKAIAFENWYGKNKDQKKLEASLNTYHAAFKLADYVERSYNSDEARLFLNKIKYSAHNRPIAISLQLYELTNDKKFLEDAYYFDQLNKASILSLNSEETSLRKKSIKDSSLFQQENFYKTSITRLSLKAARISDSVQLQQLKSSIRDLEIELGKVLDNINVSASLSPIHLSNRIPTVDRVKKILDENTALLSYHLSETEIVIFGITKNNFFHYRNPINAIFYQRIDSLRRMLNNSSGIFRNQIAVFSAELYSYLITPVQLKISSAKRLLIIPDDELHYLPFDVLIDAEKKYLIEKFSTQYLYSTALLTDKKQTLNDQGTLAFAPFTKRSFADSTISFSRLPETQKEISNLNGESFVDSSATKSNFLLKANSQGILHLATHAQLNNENPMHSFIVFYPTQHDSTDSKLYAQEIYNLRLDSTRLVILSACETGTGQLIKGEGLMSLSRAFSFAGCPNVITSLWKASDQSTAIIVSKLHYYLSRGFAPDMALQKAKTDLLHNTTIDPRFKQPNYWAHLVSVGNYDPIRHGLKWRWVAIGTIVLMLVYYFTKKTTTKKLPDTRNN
jgi:CHAT domain-containing protein